MRVVLTEDRANDHLLDTSADEEQTLCGLPVEEYLDSLPREERACPQCADKLGPHDHVPFEGQE